MVKAELSHNPYLLETEITFNGSKPKINSLVEKHQAGNLQNWIADLPDIFYSEMNGWDFDLDFVGTKIDYEALQSAFDAAGIGHDSVRIFHKNELESVDRKSSEIAALLEWFKDNPNCRFDYPGFWQDNATLFDTDYSFVIVQGPATEPVINEVTIENVPSITELVQAALDNVPVLFYVNDQNRNEFRRNLVEILKRPDVSEHQLFFCLGAELNRSHAERVIRDLGVDRPQIVDSPTARVICRYFEVYPMTVFVQQAIKVFLGVQYEIGAVLQAEKERSISINSEIHQRIDRLEEIIQKLKSSIERISQRDNFELPDELTAAKNEFVLKVINWRKRKIKMTSDDEAVRVSGEFTSDILAFFNEYIRRVKTVFQTAADEIDTKFQNVYCSAEFDDAYKPTQAAEIELSEYELPVISTGMLEMKTEQFVVPNDTPLGFIKDVFGNTLSGSKEPVRVVTYLYQEWRDYTVSKTAPALDEMLKNAFETLTGHYERVAQDYLDHLNGLVEQQIRIKDKVAAQLSDDERKLQDDNDWFAVFQEKLREIERS